MGPENLGCGVYRLFHLSVIKDRFGRPNPTKASSVSVNANRTSRSEHAKRSVFWGLIELIRTESSRGGAAGLSGREFKAHLILSVRRAHRPSVQFVPSSQKRPLPSPVQVRSYTKGAASLPALRC